MTLSIFCPLYFLESYQLPQKYFWFKKAVQPPCGTFCCSIVHLISKPRASQSTFAIIFVNFNRWQKLWKSAKKHLRFVLKMLVLMLVQTTSKLNSNCISTFFKTYIFVLVMIPLVLEICSCQKWKRILDCCLKSDKKLKLLKTKSRIFLTV